MDLKFAGPFPGETQNRTGFNVNSSEGSICGVYLQTAPSNYADVFGADDQGELTVESMPPGSVATDTWYTVQVAMDFQAGKVKARFGTTASGTFGAWSGPSPDWCRGR